MFRLTLLKLDLLVFTRLYILIHGVESGIYLKYTFSLNKQGSRMIFNFLSEIISVLSALKFAALNLNIKPYFNNNYCI